MSKYTIELRYIVEQAVNTAHPELTDYYVTDESYWSDAYTAVGLADYPIYDESHRSTLNNMIIRRYLTREIGQETAGLFKLYMRERMHEIMPLYNLLYEAQALATSDPLNEIDMVYTNDIISHGEDTSTSTDSNDNRTVYHEMPMNMLEESPNFFDSNQYATTATKDTLTGEASASGTSDGTTDQDRTEKGHRQSLAKLYEEYARAVRNIDLEIVDELQDLFFGLW